MNGVWPEVKLGDVLRQVERRDAVDPDQEYRFLGAKWYALGLYVKEALPASAIAASHVYRVERGDFVYNRLFAWKGSFAVATEAHAGCVVSNEFPCFRANDARLDTEFLWWYFKQEKAWSRALGLSVGATPTSRNRLKEAAFLSLSIPLPPLAEQRRIVARLDALAAKIEVAKLATEASRAGVGAFRASVARTLFADQRYQWQWMSIEQVTTSFIDYRGRTPPIVDAGIPHLTSANVKNGRVDWTTSKFVSESTYERYMTRGIPQPGDVLFTMEAPLGEAAVIPDNRRFSLAQRTLLMRPNRAVVSPEFLREALRSPAVRDNLYTQATGTTVKGIASKRLRRVTLPVPPLPDQARIVATLDAIGNRLECTRPHAVPSRAALDALLPSLMDRAFAGAF